MRPPRGRGGGFGGRDGGRGGGRGGFGGRGGGRGGWQDQGPPESVVEAGHFSHPCEGEAVCKLTNEKVTALLAGHQKDLCLHVAAGLLIGAVSVVCRLPGTRISCPDSRDVSAAVVQ